MAATNPFRVSDLIAKYGWQIMPYLSNLGVRSLAEAQVLFVDSGHTNALDADDTEHGHSLEKPLATWDYAVGLLTADEGGIILMAPGHNENIADGETINNDVNGVVCIGLGTGTLRPRFDFDAAASTIDVGANNVTFVNLTFMPGAADVLIGIDVKAGKTNFRMVDCECLEGEAVTDEFLAIIELKAGCHDAVIENNVFRADWGSDPDDGISLKGASNNVTIRGNRFSGPYGSGAGVTAAISNSAGVCLDLLIENNIMKVLDGESGIEVISTTPAVIRHNLIISSTTATIDELIVGIIAELDQNIGIITDGTSGEFIKGGAISPEVVAYNLDHLAKVADGGTDYPGQVIAQSILGMIMATDGDPANFVKGTDSLQAIRDKIDTIASPTDVTDAVAEPPDAKSLQDILHKDASYTYDNTKHSLEMIAENLSAAIGTVTAGSVMDILKKLYYAADGGSTAFPTTIANDSALAKIMVKATPANIDQFDNTTDSLEAIADAVTGFTTAVSQTPTARSVQDILEKDSGGTFDAAYDSLEAIADRLIDADIDKLMSAADGGSNAYPDSVVQESVIAFILSMDANPVTTSYNNTTDSLEAIRNRMDALNVADQVDLDAILVDTALWDTSAKARTILYGSDTSGATAAKQDTAQTDLDTLTGTGGANLETATQTQIDDILADTIMISGGSLPVGPVSGSLATFISGSSVALGQPLPASTSLVDIIGNFTGAYNATDPDDNIKACLDRISKYICDGDGDYATGTVLPSDKSIFDITGAFTGAGGGQDASIKVSLDLAHTDLDAIITKVDMGRQTAKAAGVILTGGDVDVFTVATGPVKITSLFFIIATAADAACKAGFSCTPTAGTETDLTPTIANGVDINGVDTGDIVYSEMDDTIMIVANTDGGEVPQVPAYSQIVPIGSINLVLQNSDPGAGIADVYIQWEPLAPGATLVAT